MNGSDEKNIAFGRLAVEMNLITKEKLNKAMVVQSRIFEKTKITMAIGSVLMEMGAISVPQRDQLLDILKKGERQAKSAKESAEDQTAEEGTLDIVVTSDRLTATAHFDGKIPTAEITPDDIKTMLHADGITQNIVDDEKIQAFLDGKDGVGEEWVVASGTAPILEVPARIVYHFETDPLKIGTITEEGQMERIDWKERGELPQVKENDLLAELIPGTEGKEGIDVYGKTIPVPQACDVQFKCGRGAGFSDNGHKIHATQSGTPRRALTGEISVMPIFKINGNVGIETGHIEFEGHIEVAGTIEKGYRVKGLSLAAEEILDAEVDIEGDIGLSKGIFGATIKCEGNLKANHINNATIAIQGDLAIGKEIIDSTIETNGRCLSYNGVILSSEISAKMGIMTLDIGTPAAKPCKLTVGIDQKLDREIQSLNKAIKCATAEAETLPKQIEELRKQSDQINTALADVAQKQDFCVTRQHQLEKEIEDRISEGNEAKADALQDQTQKLSQEQQAYDEKVAELLEQDEAISEKLSALEKADANNKERLAELKARHDKLVDEKQQHPGEAVVKVGGTLYSGTTISGPNSSIHIDRDRKSLSIYETNKPNHEGMKPWRFEIGPYR